MYHVSLVRQIDEIILDAEAEEKQSDGKTRIPNRMVKWYSLLSRNLPPSSAEGKVEIHHLTPLAGKFLPPAGQNLDTCVQNSSSILNIFETVKVFKI